MGVVRRLAVPGLDEAARKTGRPRGLAVGAIDETGQVKAGTRTAGVKLQYLGCVGKVASGINTVHLSYVREGTGHALIAAREWIPAAHIGDPVTSAVTGCRMAWPSAPRASWPSTSSPRPSPTASGWTSCAATRSTAHAPNCASSAKTFCT
jgi:hypothetical protein